MSINVVDKAFPAKATTNYVAGTVVICDSIDTNTLRPIPAIPGSLSKVPLGVITQNTDYTLKQLPTVRLIGTVDAIAGAAIDPSVENRLMYDTSGHVVPITNTTGSYPGIGFALEQAGQASDVIEILVAPQTFYHS